MRERQLILELLFVEVTIAGVGYRTTKSGEVPNLSHAFREEVYEPIEWIPALS